MILGFDVPSVQYHEKLPWQIPGKKNFPLSPTLLYFLFSPCSWGSRSPVHSETHQRGQKWNDGSCHSSNLSILLTYDMIDFPSECSNTGLSSFLSHCGNSSCVQPGLPESAWHAQEQLKWIRMKFESAIFHLSITFQRDPLTTNRETLAEDVPIRDSPCDGGPLPSLIKILAVDPSFAQVHDTNSHCSRNISFCFSRCYWSFIFWIKTNGLLLNRIWLGDDKIHFPHAGDGTQQVPLPELPQKEMWGAPALIMDGHPNPSWPQRQDASKYSQLRFI